MAACRGLLSAWALAHCLSGALAGGAAPNASAGEGIQRDGDFGQRGLLNEVGELKRTAATLKKEVDELLEAKAKEDAKKECDHKVDENCTVIENLTEGCCKKCSNAAWSDDERKCLQDEVEWYLNDLGYMADKVGQGLKTDVAFFVALIMVLQWHLRFHFWKRLRQELCSKWDWQPQSGTGSVLEWLRQEMYSKPMMLWRRLGLNILILGIYNDDDIPFNLFVTTKDKPFCCSIGLIFVDTVVLYYFFAFLGYYINPVPKLEDQAEWIDPVDEHEDDGRCPEKCQADNIYEDFTIKFRRALPIFIAQIGLITFYMKDLNKNPKTHVSKDYHYGLWMVAVIFQMHAGDEQVGAAFNLKFWMHILGTPRILDQFYEYVLGANRNSNKMREPLLHQKDRLKSALQKMRLPPRQVEKLLRRDIMDEDVKFLEEISSKEYCNRDPEASAAGTFFKRMDVELQDEFKRMLALEESLRYLGSFWHRMFVIFPLKFEHEWMLRCGMDFMVNSVARTIILYTVPILVCVEHPLDCVKDLTAVMFITTIDSIGDNKDLAEILAKLKYRANYGIERREVEPQTVCLNMFEKNYIQGHPDCFSQLDFVGGDAWKKFRLKGIPMTEEELEAEEELEGKAQR